MSIQSEITRLRGNVSDALSAIADKGVTVPSGSNSDDLADLISQITGGGSVVITRTQDSHGGDIVTITTDSDLDLSEDTVAADKLLYGYTAHDAGGQAITGTYQGGNANVTQDANGYIVLDDDTPSGSTQSSSSNEIEFNPMQSGSGDPSPSNVRSIIPGLTFTRDDSSTLTAYGGVLNTSTGVLTVDRTIIVYNSSSGFTLHSSGRWYHAGLPSGFDSSQKTSAISNMALYGDKNQTYAAWFAAGSQGIYINRLVSTETDEEFNSRLQTTPFQLCYYLASPVTYQLTANEITRAVSAINSYTLVIGGVSYEGVTGIQATDANDNTETYIRPEGSLSIAANGTYDVTNSASAVVNVSPSLQAKTNISPSTSSQTITADTGYYGLSSVQINAMPSGSATTPATTITANPAISVSSGGLITATASASSSVTPTVSAGYVSSGTAGTVTVSGSNTSQLTVQAAQTIHPSTSDQTIASGKYLTGTQTIKAVTIENLTAANIKKDVVIKIGDSTDDDCVASIIGTYEGSGGSLVITDVSNTTGTTAEISVGGSGGGSAQTDTGTFTGGGGNTATISCNFAPDLIYVHGDLTSDPSLRGIVTLTIIKDTYILVSCDSSTSGTGENLMYGAYGITGYSTDTSNPYATYSNGTLTIDTVTNSGSARWNSGVTYSYMLVKWS